MPILLPLGSSPLNGLPPPPASTPFPPPLPEGLQDFRCTKGPRNSGYFLDTLPDPNDAINRPFPVEICRGMKARWDEVGGTEICMEGRKRRNEREREEGKKEGEIRDGGIVGWLVFWRRQVSGFIPLESWSVDGGRCVCCRGYLAGYS